MVMAFIETSLTADNGQTVYNFLIFVYVYLIGNICFVGCYLKKCNKVLVDMYRRFGGTTASVFAIYSPSPEFQISYSGIPRRTAPRLTCFRQNASWFLISRLHRKYESLDTTIFGRCFYRNDIY